MTGFPSLVNPPGGHAVYWIYTDCGGEDPRGPAGNKDQPGRRQPRPNIRALTNWEMAVRKFTSVCLFKRGVDWRVWLEDLLFKRVLLCSDTYRKAKQKLVCFLTGTRICKRQWYVQYGPYPVRDPFNLVRLFDFCDLDAIYPSRDKALSLLPDSKARFFAAPKPQPAPLILSVPRRRIVVLSCV